MEAVSKLAESDSPFMFDNKGAGHAAVVLANIFRYSKSEVCIYAKDMNGDISSRDIYKSALTLFLNQDNTKLKILLDEPPKFSNDVKKLLHEHSENIEVRLANNTFVNEMKSITVNDTLYHFAVGDNKMIRMELDNKTHEAICSFNIPDTASLLKSVFEKYYNTFEKIEINPVS